MPCRLVNVLIVAIESLPTLIDSSLKEAREEAVRYVLFYSSHMCIVSYHPFSYMSAKQIALAFIEHRIRWNYS
jgi:hypothetical protein